ncbi:YTH domain-containing protein ECT2-like [Nymphaea colorata]|nr:YTH domain-containing protein ECT2-like [Nymphaea colorata]
MATVAPTPDQSSDLLKKLSLDSQQKPAEIPEPTKKPSSVQYDAGEAGKVSNATGDRSTTPILQEFMDPNVCYVPHGYSSYYYGGYDGSMNEWEDYSRYVNPDGVEMPTHRVYGDNGSMMYHPGYGYPPYGAYPPDGQLYGPQTYQYAPPYYQPPNASNGQYNSNNQVPASQPEVSTTVSSDQGSVPAETTNGNANGVANGNANGIHKAPLSTPSKQQSGMVSSNGSYGRGILPGGVPTSGYQDPRFGFEGMHASTWTDGPVLSDGQHRSATSGPLSSSGAHTVAGARNQNLHPLPHVMGMHPSRPASGMAPAPGYMNRMYPNNRVYNHGAGALRIPPTYGSNCYDYRANGRGWMPVDGKFKPRGRGNGYFYYGNENMDVLNEQNKGPRAARFKNQRSFPSGVTLAVKGQNITLNGKSDDSATPDRDQYNRSEFEIKYPDAKFFVIKSYSEDDVHKSIKYNVWASTPNGNKKLDAAYQEAREKTDGCPVFLLFSVNTSGQFCGLAEMVGPVDFNKNLDYWQQDKWNGCFPVKWHIVKDIPNSLLKHITLENNDNKPVTNSRDTQEVKFEKGLEILKIFKEYVCKTSILDDFGFYEARQRQMQESRAKTQHLKQIHKQMCDGQVTEVGSGDKEGTKSKPQKATTDSASTLQKEQSQAVGERKPVEENGSVAGSGDPKGAKPATEKRVPNGVANGC